MNNVEKLEIFDEDGFRSRVKARYENMNTEQLKEEIDMLENFIKSDKPLDDFVTPANAKEQNVIKLEVARTALTKLELKRIDGQRDVIDSSKN